MMDEFSCSFCGKASKELNVLIAGKEAFICDECVEVCNEILAKHRAEPANEPDRT